MNVITSNDATKNDIVGRMRAWEIFNQISYLKLYYHEQKKINAQRT